MTAASSWGGNGIVLGFDGRLESIDGQWLDGLTTAPRGETGGRHVEGVDWCEGVLSHWSKDLQCHLPSEGIVGDWFFVERSIN